MSDVYESGFDINEYMTFPTSPSPETGRSSSAVAVQPLGSLGQGVPEVGFSSLSLTSTQTSTTSGHMLGSSVRRSPQTKTKTAKVPPLELHAIEDESQVTVDDWLQSFQAQTELGDNRLCVSMAGVRNAFTDTVGDDEIPFRQHGSLTTRSNAHKHIGYQSTPGNTKSMGMHVSVEASSPRALDQPRIWTVLELENPIDMTTTDRFLGEIQKLKPRLKPILCSTIPEPLRLRVPGEKNLSKMYCVRHDSRHDRETVYFLAFNLSSIPKNGNSPRKIPQQDRLLVLQGTSTDADIPTIWSGGFGLAGNQQTRRTRALELAAQAPSADDDSTGNESSGTASEDHPTSIAEGDHTVSTDDDEVGVSKRHRVEEHGVAQKARDVPSPTLNLPGPLLLVVKAYSELYAQEDHAGVTLRQADDGSHRNIGTGALGRLNGWRVPAFENRWHASNQLDRLFDVLVNRVHHHIERLGITTSSTVFVPYIGDVHGGSITFTGEGIHRKVKELRPSKDRLDDEDRDILHILARLAFLTHILTLANFSTNVSERALPLNSRKRIWACGRAGGRVEAEILNVFFAERHTISDRFPRSPSAGERARFWRFVDIEYCDYVAYFAEKAHKCHEADDIEGRSKNLDEACLSLFVLEGDEEWFDTELHQSLQEFSVSQYMNLNETARPWLSRRTPNGEES